MGKDEADKQAGQLQLVLLVLGAVTLGLLVGLIVLAAKTPTKPADDGACNTDSCLTLAAQLKSFSNTSLDPCDSFAQYACAGWISGVVATEAQGVNSQFNSGTPRIQERIRRILDGPLANEPQPVPRSLALARGFYQSCQDTARQDLIGDFEIKKRFNQTFAKPLTAENLPDTIFNMSLYFGAYPFFHIRPVIERGNPIILSIRGVSHPNRTQISDPGEHEGTYSFTSQNTGLSSLAGNRAARISYSRDVFQLLDIDPGLAEAVEDISAWIETEQLKEEEGEFSGTVGTIDQKLNLYFPFLYLALNLVPEGRARAAELSSVDAFLYQENHLLRVGQYLRNMTSTSSAALLAFMKWRSIQPFLPFMGQAYRNAQQRFAIASGKQPKVTSSAARATACQATTYTYFNRVVSLMYFRHFSEGQAAITEAKAIFNHMKHDMKAIINGMSYATAADKQLLIGEVDNMAVAIGIADYLSSFTLLDNLYTGMGSNFTCFTCSLGLATYIRQTIALARFGEVFDVANVDSINLAVNAYYDGQNNYVEGLLGMLEEPIFTTTANYLYKYSRFGVLLAHEIGHGFDPNNIDYIFPYSQRGKQLSASFSRTYANRSQCLSDYYYRYMVHNATVNGTGTLAENVPDIIGLDVALRTYRRLYASTDRSIPEMSSMSTEQQFFLSHAQSQCAKVNRKAAAKILKSPHAPDLVRIDGPFSQSREFASAFNCSAGTRMNPVKKCDLF